MSTPEGQDEKEYLDETGEVTTDELHNFKRTARPNEPKGIHDVGAERENLIKLPPEDQAEILSRRSSGAKAEEKDLREEEELQEETSIGDEMEAEKESDESETLDNKEVEEIGE